MIDQKVKQVIIEVIGKTTKELATRMQEKTTEMNNDGYELTNIISGEYNYGKQVNYKQSGAILVFTKTL